MRRSSPHRFTRREGKGYPPPQAIQTNAMAARSSESAPTKLCRCRHRHHNHYRSRSKDLRGNPMLRSKRGGWTACSFIIVYELFERMAYYRIDRVQHVRLPDKEAAPGDVEASNNVINWYGAVLITPLTGAHVADAYLHRYWTFIMGSSIYFMATNILLSFLKLLVTFSAFLFLG